MTNTRFIGKPFTIEDSLSTVKGFKVVSIIQHAASQSLSLLPPHHQDSSFNFSDSCLCKKSDRKRHKFLKCDCGFYAYRTMSAAANHQTCETDTDTSTVIEVALSGLVVMAEHGFRAEKQRLTKIVMGDCRKCSGKNAETFVTVDGIDKLDASGFNNLIAVCHNCSSSDKEVTMEEVQEQASYPDYESVILQVG